MAKVYVAYVSMDEEGNKTTLREELIECDDMAQAMDMASASQGEGEGMVLYMMPEEVSTLAEAQAEVASREGND